MKSTTESNSSSENNDSNARWRSGVDVIVEIESSVSHDVRHVKNSGVGFDLKASH